MEERKKRRGVKLFFLSPFSLFCASMSYFYSCATVVGGRVFLLRQQEQSSNISSTQLHMNAYAPRFLLPRKGCITRTNIGAGCHLLELPRGYWHANSHFSAKKKKKEEEEKASSCYCYLCGGFTASKYPQSITSLRGSSVRVCAK